ncbi:Dual-specificity kinase, spindle pole body (SPB) duplication and spindle checkpoint function [Basidiobolus ranarum]|uniref:Dual-specificity kinase, spindle pole body (SPB) duplication and spindle checkpoint function n=1 Tax=Basidiobolus ranarum TaxID=34480 RepID=A0ABR2W0I7_9FUNG
MAELDGIFSTREALFRKDATPEQSRVSPQNPPESTFHSYVSDFFSTKEPTLLQSKAETRKPFLTNEGTMVSLFENQTDHSDEVSEFVLDNIFKKKEDKASSLREYIQKPTTNNYSEPLNGFSEDLPEKESLLNTITKLRKGSYDNSTNSTEQFIRESQENSSTPVLSPTEDSSDLSFEFQSKLLLDPIAATPSISKTISHLSNISLPQSDTKRTSILTLPDTTISTPSDKPSGPYGKRTSSIMKWKRASRVGLGPPKRFRLEDALNEVEEEQGPAIDEQPIKPIENDNEKVHKVSHPFNDPTFKRDHDSSQKKEPTPRKPSLTHSLSMDGVSNPSQRQQDLLNNESYSPTENEEHKLASKPRLLPRPYMDRQNQKKETLRPSSPELLPRPSETLPKAIPQYIDNPPESHHARTDSLPKETPVNPHSSEPEAPKISKFTEPAEKPHSTEDSAPMLANSAKTNTLAHEPKAFESVNKAPSPSALSNAMPPPEQRNTRSTIMVNNRSFTRLEIIGRGGSSKVYKVMAPNNKIYALKKVTFDSADKKTITGYINEINLLNRLSKNDCIIKLHDSEVNYDKGYLLMVMECGEIDLAHVLQRQQGKPINLNFVRMYWEQMLQAVHAIHEEKIVHSDLKPANFLLVEGSLKLIDFGIAKAIANDTNHIYRDQQIGTVNYMSPEALSETAPSQCGPDGARVMKLGRASDVWSLGCILYQMIYGHTPFSHLNLYQKLKAIPNPNYEIDFPPFAEEVPVDEELLSVIRKCLERDPGQRLTIPELLNHTFIRPHTSTDKCHGPALTAEMIGIIVKRTLSLKDLKVKIHGTYTPSSDSEIEDISEILQRELKIEPM